MKILFVSAMLIFFALNDVANARCWSSRKWNRCVDLCGSDWCGKCEGSQNGSGNTPGPTDSCECRSNGMVIYTDKEKLIEGPLHVPQLKLNANNSK